MSARTARRAMATTVMITTGGTGGHVFPGLAVAAKLIARGARVFWLGTREGMEARLVPQHGVDFESAVVSRRARQGLAHAAARSVRAARRVHRQPAHHSSPAARRRARLRRLRVVSRRADGRRDGQAAGAARRERGRRTREPHPRVRRRSHAARLSRTRSRTPSRRKSNGSAIRCATTSSPSSRPTRASRDRDGPLRLLVVGGSLGAQALNERVPAALARMPDGSARPHRRAPGRRAAHRGAARGVRDAPASRAECVPFIDDMAARYAWADLVVCRGGALTVAELAAVGLGAIVVPLPGAIADEQTANARFLRRRRRRAS